MDHKESSKQQYNRGRKNGEKTGASMRNLPPRFCHNQSDSVIHTADTTNIIQIGKTTMQPSVALSLGKKGRWADLLRDPEPTLQNNRDQELKQLEHEEQEKKAKKKTQKKKLHSATPEQPSQLKEKIIKIIPPNQTTVTGFRHKPGPSTNDYFENRAAERRIYEFEHQEEEEEDEPKKSQKKLNKIYESNKTTSRKQQNCTSLQNKKLQYENDKGEVARYEQTQYVTLEKPNPSKNFSKGYALPIIECRSYHDYNSSKTRRNQQKEEVRQWEKL